MEQRRAGEIVMGICSGNELQELAGLSFGLEFELGKCSICSAFRRLHNLAEERHQKLIEFNSS